MANFENVKVIVKEKYGKIAKKAKSEEDCGCSCGCGPSVETDYSVFNDDYKNLDGYVAEADLALGCGLPTQYAGIKKGATVVDLGSGAGNDVFVARSLVGEAGRVIGIDMTEEMINKANENKAKLGFDNIEFRLGDIENMPIDDNETDVVISNCVINLVPDKQMAFSEIFRILKSGGHFCISDVVIQGKLPATLQNSAEMYAGCVAGALQKDEYLNIINQTGFRDVEVKTSKTIELPDDVLEDYLSEEEMGDYRKSGLGIFSITVVGYKN
jgi:ubiquinone/menaquinone biosynthesis C-methylase UbiE